MLFWRAKSAKQAVAEKSPDPAHGDAVSFTPAENQEVADASSEDTHETAAKSEAAGEFTDVAAADTAVTVVTLNPSRLSDRLAGVETRCESAEIAATPKLVNDVINLIESDAAVPAPGQTRALAALRENLADQRRGSHVLVLGPAGTGRRSAALSLAKEVAASQPRQSDQIYAATGRDAGILQAFSVPAGSGARLVRDIQDALEKSSAMLSRLTSSDSHQMSLAVLEEEHRQRSEGPLDLLKRRAEAQNIALVKTTEGFVLAPMHEGRVVKADVFRALPEALQRDVEAKVTALECELQSLLGSLPGNDVATDDRHLALCQQTAERAVKPNLSVARKLFNGDASVAETFDAIERDWTRRATECVRLNSNGRTLSMPCLQVLGAEVSDGAPVIIARASGATEFTGQIGRDANGVIAVRPGLLSRANGGFLIADAWRLAADPLGWAALSSALETRTLQPAPSPGLAIDAEAIPLQVTLVLIAEQESFAKLIAVDPRAAHYFDCVVNFEADASAVDVSEDTFAIWAAALCDAAGLRKLTSATAALLYEDARARAGDMSRVSLDIASLAHTLRIADSLAGDAAREHISSHDIKTAISRRVDLPHREAAQ
jgi:predicted ATP-dependent protease